MPSSNFKSTIAVNAKYLAIGFWLILFVVVGTHTLQTSQRSVTGVYRASAISWMNGDDLYNESGAGFLYLPSSAVVYVPFSIGPRPISDLAWRALMIGFFALAVYRLSCLMANDRTNVLFPLTTLISVPLAFSIARNGQMTMIMAALMILAAVDLSDRRWGRSAICLAIAFAFKPLVLVMILLTAAVYKPMRMHLICGVMAVLFIPFLCQSPWYVADQYLGCFKMLRIASDLGEVNPWAQFFWMLKIGGLEIPGSMHTIIRVIFALATLGLVLLCNKKIHSPKAEIALLTLSACYLMLFNPRTENNTYGLIGPVMGVFFASAWLVEKDFKQTIFLGITALSVLCSYEIGKYITPGQEVWLAPLGCTVFTCWFCCKLISSLKYEDGLVCEVDKRSRLVA